MRFPESRNTRSFLIEDRCIRRHWLPIGAPNALSIFSTEFDNDDFFSFGSHVEVN